MVTVYAGPASQGFASRIASRLGARLGMVEYKYFPDGELYLRFPETPSGDVVIVQSTARPQDTGVWALMNMVERAGQTADRVVAVVPYLAYARQDREFLEGEAVSLRTLLRTLRFLGLSHLVTVDVHSPRLAAEYFGKGFVNVLPTRPLAEHVSRLVEKPLVLAPDRGALERARAFAELLGGDFDYLEKRRDRVTGEITVEPKEVSVVRRDVVIVDDIISTGGTMAAAARRALTGGARKVVAAATHALLVKGALEKLYAAGVGEVVATDTYPSPVSKVSVAEVVADAVARALGL